MAGSAWFTTGGRPSFFGAFYYRGDHSFEGFLSERKMTVTHRTKREVDGVVRLLGIADDHRVRILDAPCGYGRHVCEIARRGYQVAGVDLCREFVVTARHGLEADKLRGEIKHGNLLALPFPSDTFDVVLNLFYSFGFFHKNRDNLACLREFARVLKPGGRLLFHTDVNVRQIEGGIYAQPTLRRLEDGAALHIDERYDTQTRRVNGTWTIVDSSGMKRSESFSMRVYTYEEFAQMCQRVGLKTIAVSGSFDEVSQAYSERSDEMIVIAEKVG